MKTSTLEVGGLLSALSAQGVEKQLLRLPGVKKAEVNYVAGSATVTYDEVKVDLEAIKARIHECGYHCSGEQLPRHVCDRRDQSGEAGDKAVRGHAHTSHAAAAHDNGAHPAEHGQHTGAKDEMAEEMGHGGGMGMQAMVRDMRNRFWVCLIFTIPIFIYSPWAGCSTRRRRPSGCGLTSGC